MDLVAIIDAVYLVASVLFIFGIKRLSKPDTAPGGNQMAAVGMLLAIVATLVDKQILGFTWIIAGLVLGSLIGVVLSVTAKMTTMPQLVGFFNGTGGAASAFVAWSFLQGKDGSEIPLDVSVTIGLSVLVGSITATGSFLAAIKLMESEWVWKTGITEPVAFPGQKFFNAILAVASVVLMVMICLHPHPGWELYALLAITAILGITFVLPIGGADMPVVVSFLNSLSGVAAALTGFVLDNTMLIIAGSLVGASGLILTDIMCKGMNRTLANVLFGAFGATAAGGGGQKALRRDKSEVPQRTAEDAAIVLESAQSVIVAPGYGLAVAQAQHVLRELGDLLKANGCEVKYAIHPVAGRMPGHMNVLLAEADVPYDELFAMEEINDEFEHADVCLVVGANDVLNPVARTDPQSPLWGMPILNCDKARTVMIIKRSLSPGFAKVDNPLFYDSKTMMLFGDAKKMVSEIVGALKG